MRNAAVVMTVVLFSAVAGAATVEMPKPRLVYLSELGVAQGCGKPRRACANVKTEFLCGCVQERNGWTLAPRIIATTSIYTTTEGLVLHELQHISDIRKSLNEYTATLLLRSFDSEESCHEFVGGEAKVFPHVMKAIERQTMMKRDGVEFADRSGD